MPRGARTARTAEYEADPPSLIFDNGSRFLDAGFFVAVHE
jgi:hypothetical protein